MTYDAGVDVDGSLPGALKAFELVSEATWGRSGGFGGEGHGDDEFSFPSGIALARDESELYVYDANNGRIKALSLDGRVLRMWRHPGAMCGGSQNGIAVGLDGTVYVPADSTHGVVGYGADGSVRVEWQLSDVGPYCSYDGHGHGISIAIDGTILVAEPGVGNVQQFDSDGTLVRVFGRRGGDKGEFEVGPDAALEVGGRLYATDLTRVLIFDLDGGFVGYMTDPQSQPFGTLQFAIASWRGWLILGRLEEPPGFYGEYPGADQVTHFWSTNEGVFPGQLDNPWGLAISAEGTWYVTESYNHRVQVFSSNLATVAP